ncbi:hypothetical protein HD806DRAFT_491916 [Xylariaceae sp. AK1471]|nr:hypothetical protein HD806DRAFT_491916 [Xylariaceae sp. AK1471]
MLQPLWVLCANFSELLRIFTRRRTRHAAHQPNVPSVGKLRVVHISVSQKLQPPKQGHIPARQF